MTPPNRRISTFDELPAIWRPRTRIAPISHTQPVRAEFGRPLALIDDAGHLPHPSSHASSSPPCGPPSILTTNHHTTQ
jgi:hypothetical protein